MKRFAMFLLLASACTVARAQSQSDLTINAVAASNHAERELASLYRQLPRTQALIASERAWLAYREAECRYAHHATPEGSMYGMEAAMCREAVTRQRITLLRQNIAERYGDE